MIAERSFPIIQVFWSFICPVAERHDMNPVLLTSMAWVGTRMDPHARSAAGAEGLMLMLPTVANEIAAQRGVSDWNLYHPTTAIDFAAFYLKEQLQRFAEPRLALAAYCVGPKAVEEAGNCVPASIPLHRYVRGVLETWDWLEEHLEQVLSYTRPDEWRVIAGESYRLQEVHALATEIDLLENVATMLGLTFRVDRPARCVFIDLPGTATPGGDAHVS